MKVIVFSQISEEEREKLISSIDDPLMKECYEQHKKEGFYNRCHKTDYCKLERERKEQEEKQKDLIIESQAQKISELQNVIIQHNELLSQIVNKIKNI